MEGLNVVGGISNTRTWLARNQGLLLSHVVNIMAAIVILIIGMIVARIISNTINHLTLVRKIDATVTDFLSALVCYAVIIFTLVAVLGRVSVQTAPVITVLGAADLTVSLALQGSLLNLTAGVLLVMFRPPHAGEYVDLGDIVDAVQNVQIFSAILCTIDGKIVVVSNGRIIASNIINFSRKPARRNGFIVGISYNTDTDKVKQLLTLIIKSDDRILCDREMAVRLNELGVSSVNFVVRVWSKSNDLQNICWDMLERIKCDFDTNGISFPYPQVGTHMVRLPEKAE